MRTVTGALRRLAIAAVAGLVCPLVCGCATVVVKTTVWESRRIERVTDAYVRKATLGIVYLEPGRRRPRIVWCWLKSLRASGRDRSSSLPTGGRRDAAAPGQSPEGAERVPVGRLAEGEIPSLPPGASIAVFQRPKPTYPIAVVLANPNLANGQQVVYLAPGQFRPPRYKVWLPLATAFDVVTFPVQALWGIYCTFAQGSGGR